MLYTNTNLKVLNEVYFGETPGITRCFQAFCEFRNKYITKRIIFTGNPNADKDKDLQRFVQEIEREFGLYSYSVVIVSSDQFNAFTIIPFFRGNSSKDILEVSKSGYRFKKEAEVSMITFFFTGLLFNADLTNRQAFAILLHEIGHNFQDAVNNNIHALTMVSRVILIYQEILQLCTGRVLDVLKDALTVAVFSNKSVGLLSKMYNKAILGKDKTNIISYVNFIMGIADSIKMIKALANIAMLPVNLIIGGVQGLIQSLFNPIDMIKDYLGERFADGFPASYGFGEDAAIGLKEMDKYKIGYTWMDKILQLPLIGHIYNILLIPGMFLCTAGDCHPRTVARMKSIVKDLEEDLNDPNLNPKLKKQLKEEINTINNSIDGYFKENTRISNPDIVQFLLDNIVYHCFGGGIKLKLSELYVKISGHDGLRADTNKVYDKLLHKQDNIKEEYEMTNWYNVFLESDDEDEEKEEKKKKKDKDDDDDYEEDDDSDYNDLGPDPDDEIDPDDTPLPDEDDYDDSDSSDYNDYDIMSSSDSSDDSDSDDLYSKLAKVGYAYIVIANNFKHIHLNVCGRKFDNIHGLADELYTHYNYSADGFFEMAMESKSKLDNPNNAAKYCSDIRVEDDDNYNYEKACLAMKENLMHALDYLKTARESADNRSDIQSKIDEELSYTNKQLNYFMRRRSMNVDSGMNESYDPYNELF